MSDRHYTRPTGPNLQDHISLENDDFDLDSLPPDCTAIPLSNGGFSLIDDEDACRVDERKWFKDYHVESRTWYVFTVIKTASDKYMIAMHRFLFGLDRGDKIKVDHKNHNGLDNRRSANLRLATTVQNSTNVRKLAEFASKYRGVSWNSRAGKWIVRITRTDNGIRKSFGIGAFATEAEAAFAFQVAAPLLKDPEFFEPEEIPPADLPDAERLKDIERDAIAKVKAALVGLKTRLYATSSYIGVSLHGRKWESGLMFGSVRRLRIGLYATEKEAAYAHDCAIHALKLTDRRMNKVDRSDLEDPGRADEIHDEVKLRLESRNTGSKFNPEATSRYRGVSLAKDTGRWISTITICNKNYYLGVYKTEIEAAFAYDVAIPILDSPRLIPNRITEGDLPPIGTMALIRRNVESKLRIAFPDHSTP